MNDGWIPWDAAKPPEPGEYDVTCTYPTASGPFVIAVLWSGRHGWMSENVSVEDMDYTVLAYRPRPAPYTPKGDDDGR